MITITDNDVREGLAEYESSSIVPIPNHVGEHFVRFMGSKEFNKLMRGEEIVNTTEHSRMHQTGSVGVCFVPVEGWEYDAESCVNVNINKGSNEARICEIESCISFNAKPDVAVVFRNVGASLMESYGRYADIGSDYWDEYASVKEVSTTRYDAQSMVPVAAYASNDEFLWFENCVYPIFEREDW